MDEVFLVMPLRSDEALPKTSKAVGDRIFLTFEDAVDFLAGLGPGKYGIFRALVTVVEQIR